MLFGVRVSLSKVNADGCCIDYCAADDEALALMLLAAIAKILERYPESVTEERLRQDFPAYDIKPINKDPQCWAQLQDMAGFASLDQQLSIECPSCHKISYSDRDIQEQFCSYCHEPHKRSLNV